MTVSNSDHVIHVEVVENEPDGVTLAVSTFELPPECRRIIVDGAAGTVTGFQLNGDGESFSETPGSLLKNSIC